MADFRTHVTFSSVLGCGYAAAGAMASMDLSTSLVAGGLCGVSGMLPDVDSDSGVPRREAMGFAAAIVPMLMLDRFDQMHFTRDQVILIAACLYFLIRFQASKLIGKFSVHRGMWHSIPAVLIFAGLAFLIAGPANDLTARYFKAFAVGLGAMSHLVLDEIYSVDTRGVVPKFKKSFGTAVKMFSKNGWANFSTYAKLAVVTLCILAEPAVFERIQDTSPRLAGGVQSAHNAIHGIGDRVQQRLQRVVGDPRSNPQQQAASITPDLVQPAPQPEAGWGQSAPQGQALPNQPLPNQPFQPTQPAPQPQWRGFAGQAAPSGYNNPAAYQQPPYTPPVTQQPAYQQPPANNYGGFSPNTGGSGWGGAANGFSQPPQPRFAPRR